MISRFMSRASAAFLCFVAAAATGQAQAQTFDGAGALRVGAFVQGSQYDAEVSTTVFGLRVSDDIDDSDIFFGGGASIGYDWWVRQDILLGLEADASVDESDADYLLTARGRIGAKLQPGWLVYFTGGVALLGIEEWGDDFKQPGLQVSDTSDDTLTGWTVGGGTEIDLHQVTLFAEYLYVDFDSMDVKVHNAFGPGSVTPFSVDVDEQLFRVGAKFKFGDDRARKGLK
jgi:opacity protein-like surface antigen